MPTSKPKPFDPLKEAAGNWFTECSVYQHAGTTTFQHECPNIMEKLADEGFMTLPGATPFCSLFKSKVGQYCILFSLPEHSYAIYASSLHQCRAALTMYTPLISILHEVLPSGQNEFVDNRAY